MNNKYYFNNEDIEEFRIFTNKHQKETDYESLRSSYRAQCADFIGDWLYRKFGKTGTVFCDIDSSCLYTIFKEE